MRLLLLSATGRLEESRHCETQVEVEGIWWLEVKVLNEENNREEICIDSICVSSFSPSAVPVYSCAAANYMLFNDIEKCMQR